MVRVPSRFIASQALRARFIITWWIWERSAQAERSPGASLSFSSCLLPAVRSMIAATSRTARLRSSGSLCQDPFREKASKAPVSSEPRQRSRSTASSWEKCSLPVPTLPLISSR